MQVTIGQCWPRTDQLLTLLVMIMSNFNLQYECLDARDDYSLQEMSLMF